MLQGLWFYKAVVSLFWHKRFSSAALTDIYLISSQVQGLVSTFSFPYSPWDNFNSHSVLSLLKSHTCHAMSLICLFLSPVCSHVREISTLWFPLCDRSQPHCVSSDLGSTQQGTVGFLQLLFSRTSPICLLNSLVAKHSCGRGLSFSAHSAFSLSGCRGQNELEGLESLSSNRRVGFLMISIQDLTRASAVSSLPTAVGFVWQFLWVITWEPGSTVPNQPLQQPIPSPVVNNKPAKSCSTEQRIHAYNNEFSMV